MNRQRRTGAPSRVLTAAAVVAITAALAGPGAHAASGSGLPTQAAIDAATAKRQAEQPPANETDKAIAQAKATHKTVPIDSLTTEYSETVATPDGHLTLTSHPDQQRVKRNGDWQTLDANLATNADGTFSPKTAASGLVLSKGGDGPLATMTSADGKKLALNAPFKLPTPTVSGDSLVYPSVAPDIDLQVSATKFGGLTTVLVVRTQAATSNPILKNLHFDTVADGVTVSSDQAGNLTAKAADGKARWTAPTPQMWDSTTNIAVKSAQPHAAPQDTTTTADGSDKATQASSTAGPGAASKVAKMPVRSDGKGIDLTPDQDLLAHGTAPYYIDPGWNTWTQGNNAWTWVQSAYPGTSNWMRTGSNDSDHPGVGICAYYPNGGSCSPSDTYRSFFQFDISALNGAVVNSATMTLQEYVSADWSCSNSYPLDLYLTGAIGSGTTWSTQPGQVGGSLGEVTIGGSGHSGCYNNVPFSYNITGTLQQYTNNGQLTFGLYGNESNQYAFKRFDYHPSISVSYDRTPNTPTNPSVYPAPKTVSPSQTNQSCGDGNANDWSWLGAGTNQDGAVWLNATVSSPAQAQLYSWDHIWDYNLSGAPDVASGYSNLVNSGGMTSFGVPGSAIKDGHSYGYSIMASDQLPGVPWSGATPTCYFKVDLTPPTVTFPTSVSDTTKQFPPSGNGQTPQIYAGQPGGIPFTAADANPSGLNASGVACLRWGSDPQLAGAAWQCGASLPSGQVPWTPSHWGTNIVYFQAEDNAGNLSPVTQYAFYAPWNPNGPAPVFGDVTGDSAPDILTADTAGNLRAYTVPGNPLAVKPATTLAAKPGNTPPVDGGTGSAGDSWANYQTTHRGSLRGGNNVDDLIVHKAGSKSLYGYWNPDNSGVTGAFDAANPLAKPACDTTVTADCSGYKTDWSGVQQIAASGDPSTTNLDASKKFLNRTGLFTTETGTDGNTALWFYPSVGDVSLGSPTKLAVSGWQGLDLISPGDWTGMIPATGTQQTHPGLWTRNHTTGELRGYTFSLGNVTIPDPSGFGPDASFPTLTNIATNTVIGSVDPTTWPVIGSDGDLSGNGHSALWAVRSTGEVQIWTGSPTGTNTAPGYAWATGPNTVETIKVGTDAWPLTGASSNNGIATDGTGLNPLTIPTSGVSWTSDHRNNANGAIAFDGSGSMLSTKTTGIWGATNLTAGQTLGSGQRIYAVDMTLTMQTDGNLILSALNTPTVLWSSGTYNHPGATATMQNDGNFVIYDTNHTALWSTNTSNNAGAMLRLQSDHNLVVYNASNQAIWSSNTYNATYNTAIAVASNGPGVDTSTSYTLSAWVRLDATTGSDQSFVCQNGDTLPPINLQYRDANKSWTAFAPTQDDWNAGWPAVGSAANSANTGQWTHLAVTYDSTTQALTLYVNGQYTGATTQATPWGAGNQPHGARSLTVGGCYMNNNTNVINKLKGAVSDVRSYPYALTAPQVSALYTG